MDYKEKCEKALKIARKLYNEAKANEYTLDMEDYESIFPELKENEDESWFKEIELMCLNFSNDTDYREKFFTWLKNIKDRVQPKQEWSEEDERIFSNINLYIRKAGNYPHFDKENIKEAIKWLKSFKDRVLPQQKQEWSDEDNIMVENIRNSFGLHCGQMTEALKEQYDKFFNKVKSLRPKSNWKPSDEQMRILDLAIRCGINRGTTEETTLVSLFNDLKKLREG